jgi:hypothetical protein
MLSVFMLSVVIMIVVAPTAEILDDLDQEKKGKNVSKKSLGK